MCKPEENTVEYCQEQQIPLPVCIVAIVAIVGLLTIIFSKKK